MKRNNKIKRFWWGILLLLFVMLCGCTPSAKSEKEIVSDLQNDPIFFHEGGELTITDYEITKRRTDTDGFTDDIHLDVFAKNDDISCSLAFVMHYELYNDGWVLEDVKRDFSRQWQIVPLHGMTDEEFQERIDYYRSQGEYDTLSVVDRETNLTEGGCTEAVTLAATKEHLYGTEVYELTQTWYFEPSMCRYTSPTADLVVADRSVVLNDSIIGAQWNHVVRYYGTYDTFTDYFDIEVADFNSTEGLVLRVVKNDAWTAHWNGFDAPFQTAATLNCDYLVCFENGEVGIPLVELYGALYDTDDFDNFDEEDYFIFDLDEPGDGRIETVHTDMADLEMRHAVTGQDPKDEALEFIISHAKSIGVNCHDLDNPIYGVWNIEQKGYLYCIAPDEMIYQTGYIPMIAHFPISGTQMFFDSGLGSSPYVYDNEIIESVFGNGHLNWEDENTFVLIPDDASSESIRAVRIEY